MIDDERGFYTWNRLKEKYELDKGLYIKYAGLLKALPANWRKFLKERRTASISNLSFSTNVRLRQNSVQLDNLVAKDVYEILIQPIKRNPTAQRTMEALLQEPSTEWSLVYTLLRKVTIDTSTRIFQYKILNNILYLNNRLYKMTITESPLCSLCGNDLETILHFFRHCSITQNLWTQMQNWLSNILDIPELTFKIVILGKCPCQGATDILINHIILMILGTYISYNKQLADQYNFVNVTTDTKNILSIWRLRGLSLTGRIQVFKALGLSKARFICTMKPYSKKFLDDLTEIQKDFIWRGRKPKIKHTSLIGDYSEGGMKDIDIKAKLESLRIQWVKRLTNNNFHSWKIIPTVLLKDVGGVSLFHSNLALSDACKLKIDNYPEFYKSVVHLWIKISATDPQSEHDILSQTLWNNNYILIKRNRYSFQNFIRKVLIQSMI